MRYGYFKHWLQPPWKFVDFMKNQGFDIEQIDSPEVPSRSSGSKAAASPS